MVANAQFVPQALAAMELFRGLPPSALAGPIKEVMGTQAYRILDAQGKPFADLWLR